MGAQGAGPTEEGRDASSLYGRRDETRPVSTGGRGVRRERGRRVEGAGEEVSDRAVQRRLLRRRQLRSLARCRRGGLELRLALARERHAQHRERARRQALSEAEARLLGARQPEALEQRAARPGGRARAQLAEVEPHNAAVCRVRSWHEAEVAQVPAMLGVRLQEGRGHGMGGGWRGGGTCGLGCRRTTPAALPAPPRPAPRGCRAPRRCARRRLQGAGRGAPTPLATLRSLNTLATPRLRSTLWNRRKRSCRGGRGGGRVTETDRGNGNDSRKLQRFAETATIRGNCNGNRRPPAAGLRALCSVAARGGGGACLVVAAGSVVVVRAVVDKVRLYGMRWEMCPVSTEGWTRRVHFVREGGGGGGGPPAG